MKDIVSDFTGIIEDKVNSFAQRYATECKGFIFNEKTNEESITFSLKGFDVSIFTGDNLTYGYPLFEDTENLTGYSILTRFKFFFSPYYFSPYDIHNVIESKDFGTLDFHTLQDAEDVAEATEKILGFIEKNIDKIAAISGNLILQKRLKNNYEHDLSAVSKKITPDRLKENFRKYTERHELNLYFLGYANPTYSFANSDKYKELDKYFKRKSKKGRLTVFEQRLYTYLEDNGYEPVSDEAKESIKKQQKKTRKTFLFEVASYLIGGFLSIITFIAVEKLTLMFFRDSSYRLLGIEECPKSSFFLILICYRYIIIYISELLFIKKEYSSQRDKKAEKKASAILLAVCCAAIIFCTGYNYLFEVCTVAVHESGIYVGTQTKNEIIPFVNDRVEFFLIEGYTDPETDVYHNGYEDKDLYIVVDKKPEDYIICFNEELEETVSFLKEKGIGIISVKDYESFSDAYVYDE